MSDKKISELPVVTEVATTDLLAVVSAGITSQITATDFINSPIPLEAVLFNTAAVAPAAIEGIVFYDADNKTLSLRTELADVTLQVGQEMHLRVLNDSGTDVLNGKAVYITGVSGDLPTVALAKADSPATALVIGLATSDILNGAEGRITLLGLVRDIDTSGFGANDDLFLSATVAGDLVNVQPTEPNTVSLIGKVIVSDALVGTILVNAIVNSSVLDRRYQTTAVQSWSFGSPAGTSGTYYTGGYYLFGATDDDFSPSIAFGTADSSYAAHFMVVLGAITVDELTIRVTGTSINDTGTRVAGATEDIVIPNGTAVNAKYETAKKWLGQVTVAVVSGTPKTCNYGWAKYWDNNNTSFILRGVEAKWLAGANDASPNLSVIHHKATGWTFNLGAKPTPPYVVRMNTDHVTEIKTVNGEPGAWKRDNLSTAIDGGDSEGVIIEIFTTANKAFDVNSNINVTYSPI